MKPTFIKLIILLKTLTNEEKKLKKRERKRYEKNFSYMLQEFVYSHVTHGIVTKVNRRQVEMKYFYCHESLRLHLVALSFFFIPEKVKKKEKTIKVGIILIFTENVSEKLR